MCASKGSVQYTISDAAQAALYQQFVMQQPNLYLAELEPRPEKPPEVADPPKVEMPAVNPRILDLD